MFSALAILPLWYLGLVAFSFGIIIGSFLNVYIYRFHTGKSLAGHSHCLSCARRLSWYELFPLLSYLALRGRCRTCFSYIPVRYFLVEALTGILFALVAVRFFAEPVVLLLMLGVVVLLVVVLVYDLYHMIIPDAFTLALLVLALLHVGYGVVLLGDITSVLLTLGVAMLGSGFFFALWYISGGKWLGFGDVKLVFPLGLLVGSGGVFSMIVLSFWVGAVVSLALLGLQYLARRGQARLRFLPRELTMASAVPFAPFLIAGFLLVRLFDIDVLTLFVYEL